MRVDEAFGLQKRIEAETALLTLETDKSMVDTYKAAVDVFDAALKRKSTNSQSIAVILADEEADAAWSGLNLQCKAVEKHPIEAVRNVGAEALAVMRKYGNITAMPYNEEYGNMYNLLQDLDAMGVEKQKQIFIDAWVAELHTQYDAFMAASAARTAEEALRITGLVKEARKQADAAFRTLVERVNALVIVNGEEPYATFIDHVNVILNEARATLAARTTRAKTKKDNQPQE